MPLERHNWINGQLSRRMHHRAAAAVDPSHAQPLARQHARTEADIQPGCLPTHADQRRMLAQQQRNVTVLSASGFVDQPLLKRQANLEVDLAQQIGRQRLALCEPAEPLLVSWGYSAPP